MGEKVVCISRVHAEHLELQKLQENGDIDAVRLFLTLKPDDDPEEILKEVKGISALARDVERGPLIH